MSTKTTKLHETLALIESDFNALVVAKKADINASNRMAAFILRSHWRPLKRDQHAMDAFMQHLLNKHWQTLPAQKEASQG